jgi:hypothetical protein
VVVQPNGSLAVPPPKLSPVLACRSCFGGRGRCCDIGDNCCCSVPHLACRRKAIRLRHGRSKDLGAIGVYSRYGRFPGWSLGGPWLVVCGVGVIGCIAGSGGGVQVNDTHLPTVAAQIRVGAVSEVWSWARLGGPRLPPRFVVVDQPKMPAVAEPDRRRSSLHGGTGRFWGAVARLRWACHVLRPA